MDLQKELSKRKNEILKEVEKDCLVPNGWRVIQRGIKTGCDGSWVLVVALQHKDDWQDIRIIGEYEL
jgi:hypothetical protein